MLKDHSSYQPFPSEPVGRRGFQFVVCPHSGSSAIRHVLKQAGLEVFEEQAMRLKAAFCTLDVNGTGTV